MRDELCEWQAEYVFGGKLLRLRLRLCDHGERHDVHVIDGAHVLLHVFFPSRRSFLLLQGGGET